MLSGPPRLPAPLPLALKMSSDYTNGFDSSAKVKDLPSKDSSIDVSNLPAKVKVNDLTDPGSGENHSKITRFEN